MTIPPYSDLFAVDMRLIGSGKLCFRLYTTSTSLVTKINILSTTRKVNQHAHF